MNTTTNERFSRDELVGKVVMIQDIFGMWGEDRKYIIKATKERPCTNLCSRCETGGVVILLENLHSRKQHWGCLTKGVYRFV